MRVVIVADDFFAFFVHSALRKFWHLLAPDIALADTGLSCGQVYVGLLVVEEGIASKSEPVRPPLFSLSFCVVRSRTLRPRITSHPL